MFVRNMIITSVLTAGATALAIAQTSADQGIKETGIEGKLELVGTGGLPPASPFASLAKPKPKMSKRKAELERELAIARKASMRKGFVTPLLQLKNPNPAPSTVVGPEPNFLDFPGLTSEEVGESTGFVSEPPDQGLAVADGFVFEAINFGVAVYDTSGSLLAGPADINLFFGLPPIEDFTTGRFGPEVSDPRIYFDHELKRWFVSVTELDIDPIFGNLTGRSHVYLAVSTSRDPLAPFNVYAIDTTDDGSLGTPAHRGCPCFADEPLIGADKYGFYISTNEFSIPGLPFSFNGSNIYALSKELLALGALPTPIHFSGLPLAEAVAYSVEPAFSLDFTREPRSGVEYFLSALDFTGTLDDRIAVWAMLDTKSLVEFHPYPTLTQKIIRSEVYGQPPDAVQKPGPFSLGMLLGDPLEKIADHNDDRMQQVVFENGKLWSSLNTVVGGYDGRAVRTGVAYFIVDPNVSASGILSAHVRKDGYVAAPGLDSVLYPAVGATPTGRAAIVFTLVGPTRTPAFVSSDGFYPSMAFTILCANGGAGEIQLGGAGSAPEDGYSGYPQFGGNGVARWGDYSAAVADTDNSIWMATEWIPNTPRASLTNFGTLIGQLR